MGNQDLVAIWYFESSLGKTDQPPFLQRNPPSNPQIVKCHFTGKERTMLLETSLLLWKVSFFMEIHFVLYGRLAMCERSTLHLIYGGDRFSLQSQSVFGQSPSSFKSKKKKNP